MTTLVACALGGYLAGSIPFAVLVSRALGLPDPRTYGSGNIGATNVLRSGHRVAALLTVLGDAGKGWAAVLVARLLGVPDEGAALVGFAAFVGHVFPVWLRFHGGKGVATAGGVLIALDWRMGVAAIVAWLAIVLVTRYSSLAAIVAAVCAPVAAWYLLGPGPFFAAVAAMSVILVLRHHANIGKLLRGEESRIGQKKTAAPRQNEGTAV
ncbi:MAG TPA: glycerol-3-phosphate 1-O-acyltransferase PlsY [Usitatibacter sp.]|nr:glycerol-3-phosphate 1-O-acyltransferase PlsY [Usitatibacter sp.]